MVITDEQIFKELRKISRILTFANAAAIENELNKIATNEARKKMWLLIDGKKMPKELAKETGVSIMAVSRFLNAALAVGLIDYAPLQPPLRIFDYVPPGWLSLIKLPETAEPDDSTESVKTNEEKLKEGESNG